MPDLTPYFDALDATWPAEEVIPCGPFILRRSAGGGKRVTAATAQGPATVADIEQAERGMRDLDQLPMFSLRPDDGALDDLLASQGYASVDRTNILTIPAADLAAETPNPEQVSLAVWEPLAIQLEYWTEGGIGPDRISVMERADCTKTTLIGRHENSPGGTAYIGIHDDVAMLHALEIVEPARRMGVGTSMTIQAAQWAQAQGATTFCALCVESNTAANALFAKLGMQLAGQYHYRIKES